MEETGLNITVRRLIGIYTSPNILLEYPDGNKWQLVVLHFEAVVITGELTTSDESTDLGYFSLEDIIDLDMSGLDRRRVADGFSEKYEASICDNFPLDIS